MSGSEDSLPRDICGRVIYRPNTPTYRIGMSDKSSGFYIGHSSGWLSFDEATEEANKRNIEYDRIHSWPELIPQSILGGSTT